MFQRVMERTSAGVLCAILAGLCVALYGPHLANRFVSLDDGLLIYNNPLIRQLTPQSVAYAFRTYDPELYVPLTLVSYQVEYALFGLRPGVFHLTNLLLHIGNVLLVFGVLTMLVKSRTVGFMAALLFAVHPIQMEAVLWAAARKDVLSSFFFLGSLALYLRYREDGSRLTYGGSIALFLVSLLSKVSGILLPVVLLGVDWLQGRKWSRAVWMEKMPFFALSALFGIVALGGKSQAIASVGVIERLLLMGKSTVFLLGQILFPLHLSVIYPQSHAVTLASPEFFVPAILVCVLCGAAFAIAWRSRLAAFGLLFFLGMLAPSFSTFYKNGFLFFASDRYVYLASIGIFLLVAMGVERLVRWGRGGDRAAVALTAVVVIVLSAKTFVQGATWKNSEALYRNVLSAYPESAIAHTNLGDVLRREGRIDEAEAQIEAALRINPELLAARVNAGLFSEARGDIAGGIAKLRIAAEIVDQKERVTIDEVGVYFTLAAMLERSGDYDGALAVYRHAVTKTPQMAESHHNLGLMLEKRGRTAEAIDAYGEALALHPRLLDAHYHLAALLASVGRLPEAVVHVEAVLAIDPGYEKAAEHLQNMRAMMGR